MKIGFIGLGIMGSRMAANLQKAGHTLAVFNRTPEKAQPLVANGATKADSPVALAQEVEVVFTMLAHPEAVEEAALGQSGFLSGLAPGQMWVDCSTVHPSFSRRMAAEAQTRRIRFLGAPVSGSKNMAATAKLTFLVGGEEADFEICLPLLTAMGDRIIYCGRPGMGNALKMVMNQLLGTAMAAFAEAVVLGGALGLPQDVLYNVLLSSAAAAPFLKVKQERIQSGNFDQPDFPLRWLQKDLHLAGITAHEAGVAMPLTNLAKDVYRLAIREGHGDEDFSAIWAYLARNCKT